MSEEDGHEACWVLTIEVFFLVWAPEWCLMAVDQASSLGPDEESAFRLSSTVNGYAAGLTDYVPAIDMVAAALALHAAFATVPTEAEIAFGASHRKRNGAVSIYTH